MYSDDSSKIKRLKDLLVRLEAKRVQADLDAEHSWNEYYAVVADTLQGCIESLKDILDGN